jgi:4-amino-4-deoxychorismate mutase
MKHTGDIVDLRQRIDDVDAQLMELLASRFRLCIQIGILKEQANMPVMQPGRVIEVTQRAAGAAARLGVNPQFAQELWRAIIMEACRLEDLRKAQLLHQAEGAADFSRHVEG